MCLESLWTKKKIAEWLEKQPDIVTAYKAAQIKNGKLFPPFYKQHGPYTKKNIIEHMDHWSYRKNIRLIEQDCSIEAYTDTIYYSYFHFIEKRADAERYLKTGDGVKTTYKLIVCKIPKSSINVIGRQEIGQKQSTIIVASEFTILGNNEYFTTIKKMHKMINLLTHGRSV